MNQCRGVKAHFDVKTCGRDGGKDKALNIGKNKQAQPVHPAGSRGKDIGGQCDPFNVQLQECR